MLDRAAGSYDEEIELTWYNPGDPLLIHTEPGADGHAYGVCTVLVPMADARLTRNGVETSGSLWPNERGERLFSTCALAFFKVGRKALGDNRLNCLNYPAGDGGHSSVFALLADNLNANRQSGDADHRHRDGRREKH